MKSRSYSFCFSMSMYNRSATSGCLRALIRSSLTSCCFYEFFESCYSVGILYLDNPFMHMSLPSYFLKTRWVLMLTIESISSVVRAIGSVIRVTGFTNGSVTEYMDISVLLLRFVSLFELSGIEQTGALVGRVNKFSVAFGVCKHSEPKLVSIELPRLVPIRCAMPLTYSIFNLIASSCSCNSLCSLFCSNEFSMTASIKSVSF